MAENETPMVGGLLLAAGGSSRLGRPKQLLEFEGETLIARAARSLMEGGCSPVVAVVGSNADEVAAPISDLPVIVTVNDRWNEGMSTSIVAGLDSMLEAVPQLDAVIITLCDQPFVTWHTIHRLLVKYIDARKSIISAGYDGALGVPALFGKELFGELRRLTGDKGARHVIRNAPERMIAVVNAGEAAFDVDTAADLQRLIDRPISR